MQVPGPPSDCGWVGANDDLWCVSTDGDRREPPPSPGSTSTGATSWRSPARRRWSCAAVPAAVVRFDWRSGDDPRRRAGVRRRRRHARGHGHRRPGVGRRRHRRLRVGCQPVGHPGDREEPAGHPRARRRRRRRRLRRAGPGRRHRRRRPARANPTSREPDDNGIDDPPVAVDDPVTARSGASVPVQVTVNDYDPDGEAIAVSSVGHRPATARSTSAPRRRSSTHRNPDTSASTSSSTRSSTATAPRHRRR